jgi:hypothetical protein
MQKFLCVLALTAAATPLLSAQSVAPGVATYSGPVTHAGTYDITSGVFTAGTTPPPPPGTALVYDNSATNGSFFAGGTGLANMDWGTLAAGGLNDIVSIDIGYATSLATTDLIVSLHEGATGFGDDGTTITSYTLTGLPGSVSGGPEGIVVTVTLPEPLKVADGAIGYSYEPTDDLTGPLLIGPPNEAGVVDAFDQYAGTGGALVGTFFFGGVPFASFYMAMTGQEPECLLVFGGGLGDETFTPGNFGFSTSLSGISESYSVLMDDYPSFTIPKSGATASGLGKGMGGKVQGGTPNLPTFLGSHGQFALQLMMWNPTDVPSNPEQYSPVLVGRILPDGSVFTRQIGSGDINVQVDTTTNAKGETVVSFPFTVDM